MFFICLDLHPTQHGAESNKNQGPVVRLDLFIELRNVGVVALFCSPSVVPSQVVSGVGPLLNDAKNPIIKK